MTLPEQQIRYSTDNDLHEILRWLKDQEDKNIDDTFYCNRNLTIKEHNEKKLIVYIDHKTNLPVAYQWGGLINPGILEVRKGFRGFGIGRKLVEYRINEARQKNIVLLNIECNPYSSIPFWKHMGFTLFNNNGNNAYMIVEKKNRLPKHGSSCSVNICLYHTKRQWDITTLPIKNLNQQALKTKSNYVYLLDRIIFFDPSHPNLQDPVISITIDGNEIYCDKVRYNEAKRIGVKSGGVVFYLDKIKLDCAT